jgi:membrane-bound lytic murein transglycosylase B
VFLQAFVALGAKTTTDSSQFATAISKARSYGIDSAFLDVVSRAGDAGYVPKAVRINVTNFSGTPDYSWTWNQASVSAVKAFIKENTKMLSAVQKKYGVRKEVVASILWVESRCGKITGTYHVPSVYLSLLLANDSANISASVERVAASGELYSTQIDSIRKVVIQRGEKKVTWALRELKALQKINERGVMDVAVLKGSWAGAFGFPQFLPSSYNSWAVDGDGDGTIDLYNLVDAANSIGNYLKSNGWSSFKKNQRKAVHHYNNSDAYVNAVFTLAKKVR